MRTLLTGMIAAAAAGSSAWAADLPVYKAPPAVAAFSWTGFYLGANLGYGWAHGESSTTVGGVTRSSAGNVDGLIGGGQLGYNWQTGDLVLGIEIDGQFSDQKASASVSSAGITVTETDKVPWFLTARGRLGWAFADRWMVYATGGGGLVDVKSDFTISRLGTLSWEESHGAWVVGAGIEQAFAQNWSWKAEYLYLDTGTFSTTVLGVPANFRLKDNIVRGGINYHF